MQSDGGTGAGQGASGTIQLQKGGEPLLLVVRGNGRETPLPALSGTEHLVIDNALVSATEVRVASLTLTNGAVLTHPGADLTNEYRLEITAGVVTVSTNSRIDVSGRGYLGGYSGANGANQNGRTLGNTIVGGSTRRNGGSYGGLGGFGNTEQTVNGVYGSFRDPNEVGSGGGTDSGEGGAGGGLVRITAGTIDLSGQILANGRSGSSLGGGGSGGGVKLTTGTLTGGGQVQASGGAANGIYGGGGGGGRIAIFHESGTILVLANITALGGSGAGFGASGSVVVEQVTFIPPALVAQPGPLLSQRPAIQEIVVSSTVVGASGQSTAATGNELTIRWLGRPGWHYVVEASNDLLHWTPLATSVTETATGRFQAVARRSTAGLGYFRIRE